MLLHTTVNRDVPAALERFKIAAEMLMQKDASKR